MDDPPREINPPSFSFSLFFPLTPGDNTVDPAGVGATPVVVVLLGGGGAKAAPPGLQLRGKTISLPSSSNTDNRLDAAVDNVGLADFEGLADAGKTVSLPSSSSNTDGRLAVDSAGRVADTDREPPGSAISNPSAVTHDVRRPPPFLSGGGEPTPSPSSASSPSTASSPSSAAVPCPSRTHMFELTTKHLPSIPTVLISAIHVSLPSAVGARYKFTFCAYNACLTSGI